MTSEPAWEVARMSKILARAEQLLEHYFFSERIPTLRTALADMRKASLRFDGPQLFAQAVTDALYTVAHDKHLRLRYTTAPQPTVQAKRDRDRRVQRYQAYGFDGSARLQGNIGYLRLAAFNEMPESQRTFDGIMQVLADTDALILDLRTNRGGDPDAVNYFMAYFVPKQTELTGFLVKQNGDVREQRMFSAETIAGPHYGTKPVCILISSRTISGGEQFAYDMQALRRATLIGQSTAGGANPDTAYPLDDHFTFFVPYGMARSPYTGTNWEGCGVAPDVTTAPNSELLEAYTSALAAVQDTLDPTREREAALADPRSALSAAFWTKQPPSEIR